MNNDTAITSAIRNVPQRINNRFTFDITELHTTFPSRIRVRQLALSAEAAVAPSDDPLTCGGLFIDLAGLLHFATSKPRLFGIADPRSMADDPRLHAPWSFLYH